MRHYEILAILPGTLAETEVPAITAKIKETIQDCGGESITTEEVGKSRLAYPIKHIRYGYFHIFTFQATPEDIKKIEEKIRLSGQVLRAVVQTFDPTKKATGRSAALMNMLSESEEKNENTIAPVAPVKPQPTELPTLAEEVKEETKKEATPQEVKTEEKPVNMQDFDKQLEAILDDKIAGL